MCSVKLAIIIVPLLFRSSSIIKAPSGVLALTRTAGTSVFLAS